jgi:hypothetical protein
MLSEATIEKLSQGITNHIHLYPDLSVKAEQFESLFASATNSTWNPYNHNPGGDMVTNIEGINNPSLKSGVLSDGCLTISSHRTTKFKRLEDKINFLNNVDCDSYICLARPPKKIHTYRLIYFPKSIINYSSMVWTETSNKKGEFTGWEGWNENRTIRVRIVKSMSDQVWIDIHESLFTVIREFNYEITK